MKINTFLVLLFLMGVLLFSGKPQATPAAAQTISSAIPLVENFSNGYSPPRFNTAQFNHNLTMTDFGWLLLPLTPGQPLSPTPQSALTLYANNVDRVTFNQPTPSAFIAEAQVWAWAWPAEGGNPATSGRVVFEGTQDTKTFTFSGGMSQWQPFKVNDTDTGDNGQVLGPIVAVRLISLQADVMFDDLQVVSVTTFTRSNLALTMSGSKNTVNVGDTISYDLTVTNTGPDDAPNVTLTDTLPFGGTFLAGSSSSACQLSLGQVVCNLGTVAANASRTETIVVQVGSDAYASVTNQATVTAQAYDSNMANNTAVHTATTPRPACADFSVRQSPLPVPPMPGEDSLTYTISVQSNGPNTTASTLQFTASDGVLLTAVTADSGVNCSHTARTVTCNLDPLAAGQSKQIYVTGDALSTMSGIQLSEATITPTIADPNLTNNVSRFRFAADPAYAFTVIGEIGVAELAAYENVGGLAINSSGEVAFYAYAGDYVRPDAFGIFRGDGSGALTQIMVDTDFPALPADQYHHIGIFSEVDVNDAGTVVFIDDISRDLPVGHEIVQRTIYTGSGGALTTIATDSENSGARFRRYKYATINNLGRVVASYNDGYDDSAVVAFESGQETTLATAPRDYYMDYVGQSDNTTLVAFTERALRGIGAVDKLNRTFPGGTVNTVTTGIASGSFFTYPNIGVSDHGAVIYGQVELDSTTGLGVEYLKIGDRTLLTEPADQTIVGSFMWPRINNQHRYLFAANSLAHYGTPGLYTGPHPVSNRVVRLDYFTGDLLFGSRIADLADNLAFDLNDSGQVGLAVELRNGRILILRADPVAEQDQDGVNDWTELGAANQGDGNGDGIPDSAQPNVASTLSLDEAYAVTFAVDPNQTLANVTPIANPSPGDAPDQRYPLGYFNFEVHDLNPGAATEVDIYLPSWMVLNGWWKYGRTPDNPTPHWYDFTFDGATGAEINGNVITLHFVDGRRGDDDLTANGIIVDPGAPSSFAYSLYLPAVIR